MLNTRDLRYFVAVAEHEHITRAAATLFVTQPALSKQIAALEREVSARLFERRRDGVRLTTAGQALLSYARDMIASEESAMAAVRRVVDDASEHVTLGFFLTPPAEVLTKAVQEFSRRQPHDSLRLRRADWREHGAGAGEGHADVALIWTPHDTGASGLRHRRLAVEPVLVAMARDHRLNRAAELTRDDLCGETIFVLPDDAGPLAVHTRLGGRPGETRTVTVTDIDEVMEGVANGLGLCAVSPSVMDAHADPRVAARAIRNFPPYDYCLVWRADAEARAPVRDLVSAFTQAWGRERASESVGAECRTTPGKRAGDIR